MTLQIDIRGIPVLQPGHTHTRPRALTRMGDWLHRLGWRQQVWIDDQPSPDLGSEREQPSLSPRQVSRIRPQSPPVDRHRQEENLGVWLGAIHLKRVPDTQKVAYLKRTTAPSLEARQQVRRIFAQNQIVGFDPSASVALQYFKKG